MQKLFDVHFLLLIVIIYFTSYLRGENEASLQMTWVGRLQDGSARRLNEPALRQVPKKYHWRLNYHVTAAAGVCNHRFKDV